MIILSVRLRLRILDLLKEHKVLNTCEVCRLLNGYGKREVDICYKGQGFTFGIREGAEPWGKGSVCRRPGCDPVWNDVYKNLKILERKHYIYSRRMRFFDHTEGRKGRASDIFRFWYIDYQEFLSRILKQTLIPYIQEG